MNNRIMSKHNICEYCQSNDFDNTPINEYSTRELLKFNPFNFRKINKKCRTDDNLGSLELRIEKKELRMTHNYETNLGLCRTKINYCPMCGRKL